MDYGFELVMKKLGVLIIIILSSCKSVETTPIQHVTDQLTQEAQDASVPIPTTSPISPEISDTQIDEDEFRQLRLELVEHGIKAYGVSDPDVLRAMQEVPRHLFVPQDYVPLAYQNHPLPIGYGQTISQPFMVAWMTELLELEPGDKVLEIGTGSGYQAAVLAELGYVNIYSIEIVPELAISSAQNLEKAGYSNVIQKQGDGYYGWEEFAPYDAIIVTAAPDHLPAPLVQQLAEGGRIVIPIGPPGFYQTLWQFKFVDDELVAINMGGVTFVPFTGEGILLATPDDP